MRQLDDPNVINLRRTQYSVATKQTRWQRIAARFCEAAALAAIALTVAGVFVSHFGPTLAIPA